jgi:uncharacterized protein (DUF736 family)
MDLLIKNRNMSNNNNSGALFKNEKTKETQPDYRGVANVNGNNLEVSAWVKTDKNGKKYMSLSFQEPYKKEEQFDAKKYATKEADKMFSRDIIQDMQDEDDLPF